MNTALTGNSNFLNFSDALNHLRWGDRIARRQWPAGQHLRIRYRNGWSSTIYFHYENNGGYAEWSPSPRMILAEDWYVLGAHQ